MTESNKKKRRITIGDIITFLIIIAIILCSIFVTKPTVVRGESMEPTLYDGNYLILNKLAYKSHEPQRGDIIVCDSNYNGGELIIKRIIGLPGDTVTINECKVYVNGEELSEPYISPDGMDDGTAYEQFEEVWEVPEESLFVMGDHRAASLDSRFPEIGFVPYDDIVGKVLVRLYPFNEIGKVE